MPPGRREPLWTEITRAVSRAFPSPDNPLPALPWPVHCGEPLTVHRDGLAGGVQLNAGCGLRGILYHTNVAWWGAGDQAG